MVNATITRNACRYCRISRSVSPSRLNAITMARASGGWPPGSSPSRSRTGSGTPRSVGMENSSHHAATDRNASRTGSVASLGDSPSPAGSPKVAGALIHQRLMASSAPPPRYPSP